MHPQGYPEGRESRQEALQESDEDEDLDGQEEVDGEGEVGLLVEGLDLHDEVVHGADGQQRQGDDGQVELVVAPAGEIGVFFVSRLHTSLY